MSQTNFLNILVSVLQYYCFLCNPMYFIFNILKYFSEELSTAFTKNCQKSPCNKLRISDTEQLKMSKITMNEYSDYNHHIRTNISVNKQKWKTS